MAKKNYFRQRNTPVENLTFIAMMVAFDAILSLFSALVPFAAIFVMLLVPLTSAFVASYCRFKFIPVYIISALGICLAVSAWNITNTVFYIFPSVLTGVLYGEAEKRQVPYSINIFISSLLSLGLFYLSLLFLKAVTGVDMVVFLLTLIRKQDSATAPEIFPLFAFAYSLAQMAIVHIFLQSEFAHLGNVEINEKNISKWYWLPSFAFLGGAIGCAFISAKAAYLLLGLGIYWALYCLYDIALKKKPLPWIILGILVVVGWLGFAALYSRLPAGNGLSLLALPLLSIPITHFLNQVLLRKKENTPKIKP